MNTKDNSSDLKNDITAFDRALMERASKARDFKAFATNCNDDDLSLMLLYMGTDLETAAAHRKEEIIFWYVLRILRDGADLESYYSIADMAFDILDTVIPIV